MNRSMPGLPVHHQLPEFTQTRVNRVGCAIQPSHPLSSPSLPAPNPSLYIIAIFVVMVRMFQIYFLSNFQAYNTVLLITITVLYIGVEGLVKVLYNIASLVSVLCSQVASRVPELTLGLGLPRSTCPRNNLQSHKQLQVPDMTALKALVINSPPTSQSLPLVHSLDKTLVKQTKHLLSLV